MHRTRILEAMVAVVYEQGYADATVTAVCARAEVSRRTFYETFESREDCFLAVLDEGHRQVGDLITSAFERAERWQDGVRGALAGLLSFFDAEPRLTRVWFVESLAAGAWALERRERNIAALRRLIVEHWSAPPGGEPHPLASAGAMATVIATIQTHVVKAEPGPLMALLGPLMGVATAPYLDARQVNLEIERATTLAQQHLAEDSSRHQSSSDHARTIAVPAALRNPRAHRARGALLHLAEHPGASNREIADSIGVTRHDQISTLLARLAEMGLLIKNRGAPGRANSSSLTEYGLLVSRALAGESVHSQHRNL